MIHACRFYLDKNVSKPKPAMNYDMRKALADSQIIYHLLLPLVYPAE